MNRSGAGASGPLVFIVAGEASGDALGGALMAALAQQTGGAIRFAGIGGEAMAGHGLASLFPMAELSVMGLLEVLPRVPRLLRRLRQTAAAIERLRPDAVVTIDAPSFCFRLAKRLKSNAATRTVPVVHYVAPQVWAWRRGRARKIARFVDRLLALLPFEPPYFERFGLACTYVGHPVVEGGADCGNAAAFRERHGIPGDVPLVCLLPGSRATEVARLLPVFREAARLLRERMPALRTVVATISPVAETVEREARSWPFPTVVVRGRERFEGFAAADAALAASGTATLELAMAGTPMVAAYRVNPLTGWLARRLIRVEYVTLVNLVLGRGAVPEFLQDACTPEALASAVSRLLEDEAARQEQRRTGQEALQKLGRGGPSPSVRAAHAVLEVIAARGRRRGDEQTGRRGREK